MNGLAHARAMGHKQRRLPQATARAVQYDDPGARPGSVCDALPPRKQTRCSRRRSELEAGLGAEAVHLDLVAEVAVVVELQGRAIGGKCVEATAEHAYAGTYPLARFLYVYVNKAPGKALDPLTREFVKLMVSKQGQEAVVKDGYFPIPAAIAREELAKVQ
jgi:hypothetical protein